MSLKVGSNGGVRVEVAATQGGRRVAIYRAQEKEPLPLAAPGVSGWRTLESPAGAGRTLRSRAEAKVSGEFLASIRF